MIRPVIEIWCRGTPKTLSPKSTVAADSGTAAPTSSAERQPMVKRITPTTSTPPSTRFFSSWLSRVTV